MKVCKNCNNLFPDDANFCPDCGSQLEGVQVYGQQKPKPKLLKRIKREPEKPSPIPEPPVPVFDNKQNHQSGSVCSTVTPESTPTQVNNSPVVRKIAIAIGIFWSSYILNAIFSLLYDHFDLHYSYLTPTAIGNAIRVVAIASLALHKEYFTRKIGRITAFALSALYVIYILGVHPGFNIFSIIFEDYSYIVSVITQLILTSIFLLNTKIWMPARILGCISCIPGIFEGLFWTLFIKDYDDIFITLMDTSNYLFWLLSAITAIISFMGIKEVK